MSKGIFMVIIVTLYILFALSFFNVLSEDGYSFYRDPRFWLVTLTFVVLVGMTAQSLT